MTATTWRDSVVAIRLAQAIYYADIEVHGKNLGLWERADPTTKRLYVQHAESLIELLRPRRTEPSPLLDAFAGITRAHAAKVVGRISPEEPYGTEVQS